MSHLEIHYITSAREAALLEKAGLPRIDLEAHFCASCSRPVGEVIGQTDDVVSWIPCAIVLNETAIEVICRKCLDPINRALGLS